MRTGSGHGGKDNESSYSKRRKPVSPGHGGKDDAHGGKNSAPSPRRSPAPTGHGGKDGAHGGKNSAPSPRRSPAPTGHGGKDDAHGGKAPVSKLPKNAQQNLKIREIEVDPTKPNEITIELNGKNGRPSYLKIIIRPKAP